MAVFKIFRNLASIFLIFKAVTCANLNGIENYSNDVESDPEMEKYIREALENFRQQMKEGIPAFNMPVLDPLEFYNYDFNLDQNLANLNLKIKEISIRGLSSFQLDKLKADLEKFFLQLKLSIPDVRAVGKYNLNGKLLKIFPLTGNGNFSINLTNTEISALGKLNFINDTLQMDKLDLDLSWGNLTIYLQNFLGGGRFSVILQKLLPSVGKNIFQNYKGNILKFMNTALKDSINRMLQKPAVKDLIDGLIPRI